MLLCYRQTVINATKESSTRQQALRAEAERVAAIRALRDGDYDGHGLVEAVQEEAERQSLLRATREEAERHAAMRIAREREEMAAAPGTISSHGSMMRVREEAERQAFMRSVRELADKQAAEERQGAAHTAGRRLQAKEQTMFGLEMERQETARAVGVQRQQQVQAAVCETEFSRQAVEHTWHMQEEKEAKRYNLQEPTANCRYVTEQARGQKGKHIQQTINDRCSHREGVSGYATAGAMVDELVDAAGAGRTTKVPSIQCNDATVMLGLPLHGYCVPYSLGVGNYSLCV